MDKNRRSMPKPHSETPGITWEIAAVKEVFIPEIIFSSLHVVTLF
jgi:hypothetical protein